MIIVQITILIKMAVGVTDGATSTKHLQLYLQVVKNKTLSRATMEIISRVVSPWGGAYTMKYNNFEEKHKGWQISVRRDCEKVLESHDEVLIRKLADLLRSKRILDNETELIDFCKKVCEL